MTVSLTQAMPRNPLQRLSDWYASQCNGEWEHRWGFDISTLDNPGVSFSVELSDTPLDDVPYLEKKENMESATEWIVCRREAKRFVGRGGPKKLEDIVLEFASWAETHSRKANNHPKPTS